MKSANDAATAIGIALSGSEAAFARRMTRTAKAIATPRSNLYKKLEQYQIEREGSSGD